jgi:CoA:oxalate CoA-transferase
MIVDVATANGKSFKTAGNPIKLTDFEDFKSERPLPSPGLGEHTETILAEIMSKSGGYDCPLPKEPKKEEQQSSSAKKVII